jgi:hypothetical protein
MQWLPQLVGIMKQNGRWGLYLGISATEEMLAGDCGGNIRDVVARMERIRRLTGAERKTFAGIILGLILLPVSVEVLGIAPRISDALLIPLTTIINYIGYSRF